MKRRKGGHYRYIRRDRFGRFNKRGRTRQRIWYPPHKKREKPGPEGPIKPPPQETEWQIRADYLDAPKPVLVDMVVRSTVPVTRDQVKAYVQNLASGLPIPEGVRFDAVEWTHEEGPKQSFVKGTEDDLEKFSAVLFNADIRIERKEK